MAFCGLAVITSFFIVNALSFVNIPKTGGSSFKEAFHQIRDNSVPVRFYPTAKKHSWNSPGCKGRNRKTGGTHCNFIETKRCIDLGLAYREKVKKQRKNNKKRHIFFIFSKKHCFPFNVQNDSHLIGCQITHSLYIFI